MARAQNPLWLVLASKLYQTKDCIRDYDDFLAERSAYDAA